MTRHEWLRALEQASEELGAGVGGSLVENGSLPPVWYPEVGAHDYDAETLRRIVAIIERVGPPPKA